MLVMLAPALVPMAMPCAALPQGMHCMRQPMSGQAMSGHPAQPVLPCHHAMAQPEATLPESSQVESPEASFQSASDDNCCKTRCCCGAITSDWAQPASSLPSFISFTIEPARPAQNAVLRTSDISGQDSARAPPRS